MNSFSIETSDNFGSITINNVNPDTYTITELVPSGWIGISANTQTIPVPPEGTGTVTFLNVTI